MLLLSCSMKVISKGLLSSLKSPVLQSFTFSFYSGDGFRIAPVSYPVTSHRSHLFKSEYELIGNKCNTIQ